MSMNKSDDDKFPCEEEALELLTKYGVDKNIIEHSKAVCKKALAFRFSILQCVKINNKKSTKS